MRDIETERLRQHVETWRRAGVELAAIKERELQQVDTRVAISQLFGDGDLVRNSPRVTTSGLVEQQAWFTKLRKRSTGA